MQLKFYLKHTGDSLIKDNIEQIEDILFTDSSFGNKIYWHILTEEIERIDWRLPKSNEVRTLLPEELDTMGEYFLKSYAENMTL